MFAADAGVACTRPTLSQFKSFKIRHTKFLNFINRRITRLKDCEKVGREGEWRVMAVQVDGEGAILSTLDGMPPPILLPLLLLFRLPFLLSAG